MIYGAIAAVLVAITALAALAGARRVPRGDSRRRHWLAVGITALVLVALTAVFDNLIIAAGLVEYELGNTSGLMIGLAPIEDFSYAVACALAVPGLWLLLRRRQEGSHD